MWLHIHRGGAYYQTWPNMYVWKTKLLVGVLLVASVVITSCSDDAAPTGPALDSEPGEIEVTVEGVVRDKETEAVLHAAEVRIYRGGQNEMLASGSADSDGVYSVAFILEDNDLPDELQIKAELDAFADYGRGVRFARSVTHDIFLVAEDVDRFAGGLGTADNPYLIETAQHLQNVDKELNAHFLQVADIDLTETSTWNDGKGFNPIGELIRQDDLDNRPFRGVYDGAGYVMDGLYINRDQDVIGLFEYVRRGVIRNVGLTNTQVSGSGWSVAGLVGAMRESQILDSHVEGEVTYERENFGGQAALLVALSQDGSEIRSSRVRGRVLNRDGIAGGLVALKGGGSLSWEPGQIRDSFADVEIIADSGGGLVGTTSGGNNRGWIFNSYAIGDISGTGDGVGGLVGWHAGIMENAYSEVNVTVETEADDSAAGGLVGRNWGTIRWAFASGAVSSNAIVGGLIGINQEGSSLLSTHWDTESTTQSSGVGKGAADGATGRTTDRMQGAAAEENMDGFDFQEIWRTVAGDYPAFRWEDD